ncbi:MAG: dTDP-4-dehydrorhamnose 3,5-epimerase [Alphaproteobacteria bacterium]|nr:dTDP-4-dehydrorhamnose 3,5-epimerase [Alphaproteobacteria bacterium]
MALFVLTPRRFTDARGWFAETFNEQRFAEKVVSLCFVQDNQSHSVRAGTVRGMHFQRPPHAQAKLVSCLRGSICDVVVDIRIGSPTYGKYVSVILSVENGKQLFIPVGFAHGFMTLEPKTEVHYKVSDFYAPECEDGLLWNDPQLGIDWPIQSGDVPLSPKDLELQTLKEFVSPFGYDGMPMTLSEV